MIRTALELDTPPAIEPVTLDEIKLQCRIDQDVEDSLLTSWITAARSYYEDFTGRAFITQTYIRYMDRFPGQTLYAVDPLASHYRVPNNVIILPKPKLQSVTYIKYTDTNGDVQTLVEDTDYTVDSKSEPARISPTYGNLWPITLDVMNAVEIKFDCGYGDTADDVPAGLKQAIRLFVGNLYKNRELISDAAKFPVPMSAKSLVYMYRVPGFIG